MKKKIKLKPCPFCGGEAELYQTWTGDYCVQCNKCGATTLHKRDANIVVGDWNRRVEDE